MSCLYDGIEEGGVLFFEVYCGSQINDAIQEAIERAVGYPVRVDFNEVSVEVRGDSDPKLIYRDWRRAFSGYIDKRVGPYPKAELSEEDKANDAKVEAENEQRREAACARWQTEANAKRERVEKQLENAEPLELADAEMWQSWIDANKDFYGAACCTYAERWGRMMQVAMREGQSVAKAAESTQFDADLEGITGFMYGCAVGMLSKAWKHGEELRRWHNLNTQIGNEGEKANESGGVLNPALLSIGGNAQ